MNAWIEAVANQIMRSTYPGALLQVLLGSLVVLTFAGVWCLLWRHRAAATRHLIWFVALLSLPLLLCISFVPHSAHTTLWSVSTGFDSGNKFLVSLTLSPSARTVQSTGPVSTERIAGIRDASSTAGTHRSLVLRFSNFWLALALFGWASGTVLGGLALLAGQVQLRRIAAESKLLEMAEWEGLVREACGKLSLHRRPALLLSCDQVMPRTWGWWRPKVLLPGEAVHWAPEKRRVVLLHELAHVKRWDCLTQTVGHAVGALFWVNPLVWVAARRLCVERERACDDLVLDGGCKASDYATQLLEIARSFRPAQYAAGIAMARSTQLQRRIAAIIDVSRGRRLRPSAALAIIAFMGVLVGCVVATAGKASAESAETSALRRQQITQLESFALAKERQSEALAVDASETISRDFQRFFQAAIEGDIQTVTNRYEFFKRHHPQYAGTNAIDRLRTPYWSPVLEICLAYDHVANCDPKYTPILADGIINSIPPGSIYFGGTDPGRGVPTAFEKSSIDGDPFFVLTQNALADATYLIYLRAMYGGKIYTPTGEDSQKCFEEYLADATRRLEENKLKPGEDVRKTDNRIAVSGQVAVMSINGLLTKTIFDRNPDREFYVEESFPLDWMYPHLEPHGLIMKINRQPQAELSEQVLARDREYWGRLVAEMLGSSMENEMGVFELTRFLNRVYVRKDLEGFKGDPLYIQNDYAKRIFSKLRSSIAGVYAWRLNTNTPAEFRPRTESEIARLVQETDLAFRQAFALCPYSPEAVFRYVDFLIRFNRLDDARLIAESSLAADPKNKQVQGLLHNIESMKGR